MADKIWCLMLMQEDYVPMADGQAQRGREKRVVREWGIEALPGVRTLLDALAASGIPCAIGSSTHRLNIDTSLDLLQLHDRFAKIVTAEDVSHGKPDPEVFLLAAERIARKSAY